MPPRQPHLTRELLHIAFPMIVSNACITLMVVTDRFFLSKLGEAEMNASMGGGLFAFLLTTFAMGLVGYGTALVAQYLGASQRERCASVTTQGLLLVAVAYPCILLISPIGPWLFLRSGLESDQLAFQTLYFTILVFGGIFPLLRGVFSGFFSGIGRTKIVMISALVSTLINLPLNWCLIFGKWGFPALGIRGAAYGTVLSSCIGIVILAVAYFKEAQKGFGLHNSFRFDPEIMRKYLRYGSPAGAEFFLNFAAFNFMIILLHAYSPVVATATTITFNWDMVSFVPLIGVEIGVTSLVGRFMGAGNPDRAHAATIAGLKIGWGYSLVVATLFIFMAGPLVALFQPSGPESSVFTEATPLAVNMLQLAAVYVCVEAVMVVYAGALRGAGDSFWAMVISVGGHWGIVGALACSLYVFKLGPWISWMITVFSFALFCSAFWFRYRHGAWREIQVVGNPGG